MDTSLGNSGETATTELIRSRLGWRTAVYVVAGALLLISLMGPGWLFVPANPALQAPAMTLNFGDLGELTSGEVVPTNALQQAYFGWLGWTLVLATLAAAAAHVATRVRPVGVLVSVLAVCGLIINTFGVKGTLNWSQFFDQTPNMRAGAYLIIVGYVVALIASLIPDRR